VVKLQLEWMELTDTVLNFLVNGIIILDGVPWIWSGRELVDTANHTLIVAVHLDRMALKWH